jgi:uncharacterized protein (DUF1800 family)
MRTYLALNRFGLGARRGENIPRDVERWLIGQIDAFEPTPALLSELPTRADMAHALMTFRELSGEFRQMRQEMAANPADPQPTQTAAMAALQAERRDGRRSQRQIYINSADTRMRLALSSSTPFMERWVHFWSNHFAVSVDKLSVVSFAGDHEFHAIRPHVRGRFADLLKAAVTHPAMLLFLDQAVSIGPDSPFARIVAQRRPDRRFGLNENLAREILELHTLGVRSGYSQADVTSFAHALTGITVAGLGRGPEQRFMANAEPGETVFVEGLHSPGERTVLGRRYAQTGRAQAEAILADLAARPETARHIATKLARHFVADEPPAALVSQLEADFLRTGGDLSSLARTLIRSPEAWQTTTPKFKTPWDWTISALRGIGVDRLPNPQGAYGMFEQLGQTIWRSGSPAGYSDMAATWAGPQALTDRVDLANRLAGQMGGQQDARALAPALLADALTEPVSTAIARADSPAQGLALLLVAPAFLRR